MENLEVITHCFLQFSGGEKTKIPHLCGENVGPFFTLYDQTWYTRAMAQEAAGTFIAVLFFMMQTDEKMFFSREKAINCFIIASGYVAARAMFFGQLAEEYNAA